MFLTFFACFLSDVFYGIGSKSLDLNTGETIDERIFGISIALKLITSIILGYFCIYEIKSALN